MLPAAGSLPILLHGAALGRAELEHCLVVSTDELLLSFLLEWEGSAAGVEEKGCPGSFLCGGAQPLPRLPEINFYLGWFKISPLNDAPVIDHTELQLEDFIQFA